LRSLFRGLLAVALAVSSGCTQQKPPISNEAAKPEKTEVVVLGSSQLGKESIEFYVAYKFDAAVLGLSVTRPGAAEGAQYFPMYASTYRGIPPLMLDVFVAKSEQEMWVRSSLAGSETLAHRQAGADFVITPFGRMAASKVPMPDHLSGSSIPFPPMAAEGVVKKASFKLE
jgi:hypothetical protein